MSVPACAAGEGTLELRARWTLLHSGRAIQGGGLLVANGVVERVLGARERAPADRSLDLGDAAITPGLVNAHAHTELSDLQGKVAPHATFPEWIAALLAARTGLDARGSSKRGLARLAATGCVAVGDIVALSADDERADDGTVALPLVVAFHEVLDAGDAERGSAAVRAARDRIAAAPRRNGISPHAPYTNRDDTLVAAGAVARELDCRVQVHWAETEDEESWLAGVDGPFSALIGPARARGRSLDRLASAGLLDARTVLVHGNVASAEDARRIARAGARVVHCPGTHAFFGREPFAVDVFRNAGVHLCLGTDSLASNADLDLGRELALAADAFPHIAPVELLGWAMERGAAALGLDDRVGQLAPGRPFTAAAFATRAADSVALHEELVQGRPSVLATWIEGRSAYAAPLV